MGSLSVKPGFVYFLKLVDPQKEFEFTHYKIGETKDIPERIRSLQTGNPFRIVEEKSIESEACNMLEHYLHGKYSPQRVGIEWFKFSDKEFKKVYTSALSFNKEITNIAKDALEIDKSVSNGKEVEPSKEVTKIYNRLINLKEKILILTKRIDMIKWRLESLTKNSMGIEGITKVTIVPFKSKFSYDLFNKNYAKLSNILINKNRDEIEKQYKLEIETASKLESEIKSKVEQGKPKEEILADLEEIVKREELEEKVDFVNRGLKISGSPRITDFPELRKEYNEAKENRTRIDSDEVNGELIMERNEESAKLHDDYFQYLADISALRGECRVEELKLHYECSENEAIKDICKYERKLVVRKPKKPFVMPKSEYVNKAETLVKVEEPKEVEISISLEHIGEEIIKSEYPKEYESCLVTPKSQRKFSVLDYRAYID